jgi:hypothetical protein
VGLELWTGLGVRGWDGECEGLELFADYEVPIKWSRCGERVGEDRVGEGEVRIDSDQRRVPRSKGLTRVRPTWGGGESTDLFGVGYLFFILGQFSFLASMSI